jgi:hypothetical protein
MSSMSNIPPEPCGPARNALAPFPRGAKRNSEPPSPAARSSAEEPPPPHVASDLWLLGETAAFLLALFLFVFTEVPLQLRYLLPLTLVILVRHFRQGVEKWLSVLTIMTAYQCLVGIAFVLLTGTGEPGNAVYSPLREYAIAVLILIALKRAPFKVILLFIGAWACAEMLALQCEARGINPQALVPFPLYKNPLMIDDVRERFRGFTAESGVLGGMSAIFLLTLILTFICVLHQPALRYSRGTRRGIRLTLAMMTAVLLTSMLVMTLTKSGAFILSTAFLTLLIFAFFARDWRSVITVVSALLVCAFCAGAFVSSNVSGQRYIEDQIDTITSYARTGDISEIRDTGFATRVQGVRLAVLGVAEYPLGVGYEGIVTYFGQHLTNVEESEEMLTSGTDLMGPKCFIFDILVASGVPGLVLLLYFVFLTVKPFGFAGKFGFGAMRAALYAGVVGLGLAVELLPMMGTCALIYCAGLALERECVSRGNELAEDADLAGDATSALSEEYIVS